jgi:hypothetical protein
MQLQAWKPLPGQHSSVLTSHGISSPKGGGPPAHPQAAPGRRRPDPGLAVSPQRGIGLT